MSFSDLVASMDRNVVGMFGRQPVTIHPQTGAPAYTLNSVVKNPMMEEDYVPGSAVASEGTGVVILFVRLDLTAVAQPIPVKGDTATYGGSDYNVDRDAADREGGYTLYLRKRTQRWDQ